MKLVNYGPNATMTNKGFNIQPCGNSAMWFEIEGISDYSNIVVRFDGKILKPFRNGNIITVLIPKEFLTSPKSILIEIFDEKDIDTKINIVFEIKSRVTIPFSEVKKPNLFLIGFPRSGTTTLYWKMMEHKEIYMSRIKEPHFFDDRAKGVIEDAVDEYSEYEKLFMFPPYNVKYIAEASTNYISSKNALEKIDSFNQDTKVLLFIRNPIISSISFYSMHKKGGIHEYVEDFDQAWKDSKTDHNRTFLNRYSQIYKVGTHTKNALSIFQDKLKIILFDDFVSDNTKILHEICQFLEIESFESHERLRKTNSAKYDGIDSIVSKEILEDMIQHFKPEIELLEQITNRNLQHWMDSEKL